MNPSSSRISHKVLDRLGLPAPLFLGFVGILIFMIGDGVESNYLAPFLVNSQGFTENTATLAISAYGIFVTLGSWLSGALSNVLGPRKVMWIGAINWIIFESIFLAFGVHLGIQWIAVLAYVLRGIGYPFFAYAFLVWINLAAPAKQRGTSVGWFWFAFGAGLPTLGSLVASKAIPVLGEEGTLWLSVILVAIGASLALFGIRDRSHAGPVDAGNGTVLQGMAQGLSIIWREPKVTVGSVVRLINTAPNFALFIVAPIYFVEVIGFSQEQYLLIVTIVYTANIFANLFFGVIGDRFGWRNTVMWFGCIMSAVGLVLLYYVPLAVGPQFWITVLCWSVFSIGLAGFVPLTALVPALVQPKERANALAVYTLAAGLSSFIGPVMVGLLGGSNNLQAAIWVFAAIYVLGALLCLTLKSNEDPGQTKKPIHVAEQYSAR